MFSGGQFLRVQDPEGDGMVAATFIVEGQAEVGADLAWVRYEEGSQRGLYTKVACSDIEPA